MSFNHESFMVTRGFTGTLMAVLCLLWPMAPARGQTADIRLIALTSPSASDMTAALPLSESYLRHDAAFVVEVWAQTSDANGLSSVSADVAFPASWVDLTAITHSATFNVLTHGTIDNVNGLVDDLSGSHLGPCSDAVGRAPNWARVAVLQVIAQGIGSAVFQCSATGSVVYGTSVCGVGDLPAAQIVFGSATVELVECVSDADCDDGQFCNGVETCNLTTHTCQAGAAPTCDDQIDCTNDSCDPTAGGGAGACVHIPSDANCNDFVDCTIDACDQLTGPGTGCSHIASDAFCDNSLYCDGAETCDAVQGCLGGTPPCTDACEHCDEDADSCDWCMLDLDDNRVMGTGDFARFAGCFGACFAPTDACIESNFDGSADGCVGSSDFAAFAGCFGYDCGQCAACSGPASVAVASVSRSSPAAADVALRFAVLDAPSAIEKATAPPASVTRVAVSETVFIEVWATRVPDSRDQGVGLACVFADVTFDPAILSIVGVQSSDLFGLFPGGSVEAATIRNVGGCAMLGERTLGALGEWVRVSIITARADAGGAGMLSAGPGDAIHGIALVGEFANVERSRVRFGSERIAVETKTSSTRLRALRK